MTRVLLVAQVPPPYHGQAVMQQYLVDAHWTWCEKIHVRMQFSDALDTVGKPSLAKAFRLIPLLVRCLAVRISGPVDLMIYPPAGDSWTGTLRDVVVLIALRPLVRRTLFHFHAGNFDSSLNSLPQLVRWVAFRAFRRPDAAVVLAPTLAREVSGIHPLRLAVVPNGIPDAFPSGVPPRHSGASVRILYVGTLSRLKGTHLLVQAVTELIREEVGIALDLVGEFDERDLSEELRGRVAASDVREHIVFHGKLLGPAKWEVFAGADVFCFPTHYPRENQPVAVIEALMAGLPVVATRWRAVAEIFADGREGLQVPANDHLALKGALRRLAESPQTRAEMGAAARHRYVSSYRLEDHLGRLETLARQIVET